ncbi:cellulose synthase [Myxococcaceae bacterium GXIMD 01537]
MGTAGDGRKGPPGKQRRESLGSALAQVGAVALVLAALVYVYVQRGRVKQETDTRLRAARALAQRGNPEDLQAALAQLQALFALDAQVYDAQVLAADLETSLWMEHRMADAEARARAHLSLAEGLESRVSERYGVRLLRAQLLLHEGKAGEAAVALEDLQKQGASSPRLWLTLARAYQARGRLLEARQSFARASEGAWRDPRYATAYGEALLDEGLYAQAGEALRKATTANPGHVEARLAAALARTYQREKEDEARKTATELTARQEQLTPLLRARLMALRAELALSSGDLEQALQEADAALGVAPDEHHALLARARTLAARRDAGARAAFEQAVERRPTAPLLYLDGARALQQAGDGAGALALLDRYETAFRDVHVPAGEGKTVGALERDDRYWLARGGVLETLERPDDALSAYDKALSTRGLHRARAQYAKGALLLARKDVAGARPLLEPLAPEDGTGAMPEAYEAMGDVLLAGGDSAGATRHYLRCLLRAKAQGLPADRLAARAEALGHKVTTAAPALTQDWADAAGQVLQGP